MKGALAIALPTALPRLMVLVGILLNQRSTDKLDARITTLEGSLRGEMKALEGSLRTGMIALRNQFHSDILMLMGRDIDLDSRITRLEERGKNLPPLGLELFGSQRVHRI
jgi:hypothetical protein